MVTWKPLLAAAATTMALLVSSAVGATSDKPHVYPLATVPQWESSSALMFAISPSGMYRGPEQYVIFPLTQANGLNKTEPVSVRIRGNLVQATLANYANISGSDQIALLTCDPMNTTFVDPDSMLSVLITNGPAAILLYSETGNFCNLDRAPPTYQNFFTMASKNDSALLLNITETGAIIAAAINSSDTLTGGSNPNDGSGPGGNSTVAMSILYSITGLITVLFLVIIGTGAMRAHRYPERYGPRGASGGRPRQSRAKGIARAMLETLPIVKFGDTTTTKPDPGLELESGAISSHQTPAGASDADAAAPTPAPANLPSETVAGSASETQPKAEGADDRMVGAAGTASGKEAEHQSVAENPSCSICTEDFTVGEDVRVLPCNHKFHPNCVDPWLVNVSGTCPLCRLDLRPSPADGSESQPLDGEASMPPPLDADVTGTTAAAGSSSANANTSHRRGPARFLDLNRLRHATVEERLEALRRYRAEHHMLNRRGTTATTATTSAEEPTATAEAPAPLTAETTTAEGEDDHGRAARLTRRLRDKFRIKTHAQSQSHGSS